MKLFPCHCALVMALLLDAAFSAELQTHLKSSFIETEWGDGDSFLVQLTSGETHTIRLYGVDCLEWHVSDTTDARRLRAQRRYFGISKAGGSSKSSIAAAKGMGELAASEVKRALAQPFTVHTAFADAGGDGKHKRI